MTEFDETKQTIRKRFPEVHQLQVDELVAQLKATGADQQPLLIDVRAADEFAVSHLPGAVQASGKQALALARAAGDRPVVVYCAVGYRSSKTAKALMAAGIENVANLEGSIFEWANAGHSVVRGEHTVREVHPFDKKWGQMLDRDLWAFEPGKPAS